MFKGSLGFAQSQVGEFPAQWPLLTELWLSEAHGDPWQVQGVYLAAESTSGVQSLQFGDCFMESTF